MGMKSGYSRVSPNGQTLDAQLDQLPMMTKYAKRWRRTVSRATL